MWWMVWERWTCFNPRRPHGRRPVAKGILVLAAKFQSAPPSRAAAPLSNKKPASREVSIRAALTGGGRLDGLGLAGSRCFNPRRPHGRRLPTAAGSRFGTLFQSAPPSRAAAYLHLFTGAHRRVSIRAALTGGGHPQRGRRVAGRCFNPRRPHGRRPTPPSVPKRRTTFQSAPPSRAAAGLDDWVTLAEVVSIRAALTGGGASPSCCSCVAGCFNPRRPHGRRPARVILRLSSGCFNPRRPHGRRLGWGCSKGALLLFQSAPPSRAAACLFRRA